MKTKLLVLLAALWLSSAAWAEWSPVPPIPPAAWAEIKPGDFTDAELGIPYMLFHFHRLANAVVEEGPTRGFIDLKVWRNPEDNQPYNARILENALPIAYFYCVDRPWNVYRGSEEVRVRLEAVLDFWAKSQNAEGLWSEYSPTNFSLAPTGFGVRHMAATLELLATGPEIDSEVHQRVIAAQKRGILKMIGDKKLLMDGRNWTNQYSGAYAATLSFIKLFPQSESQLMPLLRARLRDAAKEHQSPTGYLYEQAGPDFGYTLSVHQNNIALAWPYTGGGPVAEALVDETRRLYEWTSYNLVPQPGGDYFLANYGIATRTGARGFDRIETPLAEEVELARAFASTPEEVERADAQRRAEVEKNWGQWGFKVPGTQTYHPGPISDMLRAQWYPTAEQRDAARAELPYIKDERFTRVLQDTTRKPMVVTAVRRPGFYAVFNSGQPVTKRQRFGLGLLWNDAAGCLLMSFADSDKLVWGTRAVGAALPHESAAVAAELQSAGRGVSLRDGLNNLPDGDLTLRYPLGDAGRKSVRFTPRGVAVEVQHAGEFVEMLPMVKAPGEAFDVTEGRLILERGRTRLVVECDAGARIEVGAAAGTTAGLEHVPVMLHGRDRLTYRILIDP